MAPSLRSSSQMTLNWMTPKPPSKTPILMVLRTCLLTSLLKTVTKSSGSMVHSSKQALRMENSGSRIHSLSISLELRAQGQLLRPCLSKHASRPRLDTCSTKNCKGSMLMCKERKCLTRSSSKEATRRMGLIAVFITSLSSLHLKSTRMSTSRLPLRLR